LLSVVAAVLFVGAAGGGFALTRIAGGRPLLPPQAAAEYGSPAPAASLQPLQPRNATAAPANGVQGGDFTVKVPRDWTMFVEHHANDPNDPLPPSTLVHFVSPDGVLELTVERFPNFYPNNSIKRYLDVQRTWWTKAGHRYLVTRIDPPDAASARGSDGVVDVTYRTVETEQNTDLHRSHFARFLPQKVGLWLIEVTVPNDQEEKGQSLFEEIAPSFTPTG
jgi:hypothetical protein